MNTINAKFLIEELRSYVGRSIYVWGAQGKCNPTEGWIRSREYSTNASKAAKEQNIKRVMTLYNKLKESGVTEVYAFDCSGLLMYHLYNKYKLYSGDMTANSLYRSCTDVAKVRMPFAPKVGQLVFKLNGYGRATHVGIVSGYDHFTPQVIECFGRDRGVIEQDWDAEGTAYWDAYGSLPVIVDGSSTVVGDPEAPNADPDNPTNPVPVQVKGTVNVRQGPSATSVKLYTAPTGTYGLAYPAEDGWSLVSMPKDGGYITGYMSAKYLKELV